MLVSARSIALWLLSGACFATGIHSAAFDFSAFAQEPQHQADEETRPEVQTLEPIQVTTTRAGPKPRQKPKRTEPASQVQQVPAAPLAANMETQPVSRGALSTAASSLPVGSTTLDAKAIERKPIATYGDMFRGMTGFDVVNFGQGALAYGLAMRGMGGGNHGRDIAYMIDGMPINETSSVGTPGFADLNVVLPETIASVEVMRGPFSVECGDSQVGGCIRFVTKRSEPFGSLSLSGHSQGTGRAVATYSKQGGSYEPFLVYEGYHTDGYRDNSEVDRFNAFNKVTLPFADGSWLSLRSQAYATTAGAPGYINRHAIRTGALSPKAAIDHTDGVQRKIFNMVANYSAGNAPEQDFSGTMYIQHIDYNRWANFSLNPNPFAGQGLTRDKRITAGGNFRKVWTGNVGELPTQLLVGAGVRVDNFDAFRSPTVQRVISAPPTVDASVQETNLSAFTKLQVKPVQWLKLVGGARYDQFYYNIDNHLNPANEPHYNPGILQPKGGIVIEPVSWLNIYANHGVGFRSPSATGEVLTYYPNIRPFKVESNEVGAQLNLGSVVIMGDVWRTKSENEIYQPFVGAPTTTLGSAVRDGYDVEVRYYAIRNATDSVAYSANFSSVTAELDAGPGLYVPGVPRWIANIGVDFDLDAGNKSRIQGQLLATFVGKKNLTNDAEFKTKEFPRLTGRLAYVMPEGWTAFTQATYYPDDLLSEYAASQGAVTNATLADIVTAPVARFAITGGLTYRFNTDNHIPMP
jgi:outer membrane receptor protein involved in Fe transport